MGHEVDTGLLKSLIDLRDGRDRATTATAGKRATIAHEATATGMSNCLRGFGPADWSLSSSSSVASDDRQLELATAEQPYS